MPELPEVETVVRDLRPRLVGRRLRDVRTGDKPLRRPWLPEWTPAVENATIQAVTRRGKWIVIPLSRGTLVAHLGMTGQLTVGPPDRPTESHTHLTADLSGGEQLRFRDIRRFGSVTLHADAADLQAFLGDRLGPEPFDLPAQTFRDSLAKTTRPLKAVLLDQQVVAGVGNIYADEALHRAGLPPTLRGADVSPAEADRLRAAIVAVLEHAIAYRGSTIHNYVGGSGLAGGFQDEFRVYGRTGQPCRACGTAVERVRLAGRSTHSCPRCQPVAAR